MFCPYPFKSRNMRLNSTLMFFFIFPAVLSGTATKNELPTITFNFTHDYLEDKVQRFSINGTRVCYSPGINGFNLQCEASYPITFRTTGFIEPLTHVHVEPVERHWTNNTFKLTLSAAFDKEIGQLGSSLRVVCEALADSSQKEEVLVFIRGYTNSSLLTPEFTTVIDSNLIPCATRDPTFAVAPTLHRKTVHGEEVQVQNSSISYHPTEGFKSRDIFNGTFICRQGLDIVQIIAYASGEYLFTPKSDEVKVFSDQPIQLECSSRSRQPVRIAVDIGDKGTEYISVIPQNVDHVAVSKIMVKDHAEYVIKGKARCIEKNNNELVKEWNFEFIPLPHLHFDNFRRELHCSSKFNPKGLQMVECKSPLGCNLRTRCFEAESECNLYDENVLHSNETEGCYHVSPYIECVKLQYFYPNGVAECTVNGVARRWEFFASLKYINYLDWRTAPKEELIRMQRTDANTNNKRGTFFCEAVAYLFTDKVFFEMEYTNGSRQYLLEDGNAVNISHSADDENRVDDFKIIGILETKLPPDVIAIHCHAPWWNSTDTMVASHVLNKGSEIMIGCKQCQCNQLDDIENTSLDQSITKLKFS